MIWHKCESRADFLPYRGSPTVVAAKHYTQTQENGKPENKKKEAAMSLWFFYFIHAAGLTWSCFHLRLHAFLLVLGCLNGSKIFLVATNSQNHPSNTFQQSHP